jgi:phosphoglycerate-specific signal transduction histidine kinase
MQKDLCTALFGFSQNNLPLIIESLNKNSKANTNLLNLKMLVQSLNVWANFGVLTMNKKYFYVKGGTVIDLL